MVTSTEVYYFNSPEFNHDVVIPTVVTSQGMQQYVYTIKIWKFGSLRILETNIHAKLKAYSKDNVWHTLKDKDKPTNYCLMNGQTQYTQTTFIVDIESDGDITIGASDLGFTSMEYGDFLRFQIVWCVR